MESDSLMCAVRNYCTEFLSPIWQSKAGEIVIERIKVGMSNRSFLCSLQVNETIEKVVVKLYGTEPNQQVKCHCEATEAIIFDRLASHKLAPNLRGVFSGGRIEEYIQGRNMTLADLNNIEMYKAVARKLAHFHTRQIPITRKPLFIPLMYQQIDNCPKTASNSSVAQMKVMNNIEEFELKKEFKWSVDLAEKCHSKTVFSHNDLYLVNTLLKNEGQTLFDRFMIIDYELSDYSPRGRDLSNFLYCNEFDVIAENSEFNLKYIGNTATETLKKTFAEEYLKELKMIGDLIDDRFDNVDHLVMEIEVLALQMYLVLLIFVRFTVYNSDVGVGTLEYVNDVIRLYNSLKSYVVTKYPHLVD